MIGLITLFSSAICISLLWLGTAFFYIKDTIGFEALMKSSPVDISNIIAASVSPIIFLWIIIAFIQHSLALKKQTRHMDALINQSKRTNEHNEAVVRSMIEIQQQAKSSSMLDRVDLTIMDMNELLCEIITRCGIISAEAAANVWQRIGNGNKWAFCKILLENIQQYPGFADKIHQKALKDNMLSGSLIEFGVRYEKLINLLDHHDKERFISDVIENGILGRVFAILAPVIDKLNLQTINTPTTNEYDTYNETEETTLTPEVNMDEEPEMQIPPQTDISTDIKETSPTVQTIEEEKATIEEKPIENPISQEIKNETITSEEATETTKEETISKSIKNPFSRYFKQTNNDLDLLEKNLFEIENMIEDSDSQIEDSTNKKENLEINEKPIRTEPVIEIRETVEDNNDSTITDEQQTDNKLANDDDFPFSNWKNNYLKTGNDD